MCIEEIWHNTSINFSTNDDWKGWLLLYATECCFPHLLKRYTKKGPFHWDSKRSKYDKETKLLQEMKLLPRDDIEMNLEEEALHENDEEASFDDNETIHTLFHGSNASELSGVFSNCDDMRDVSNIDRVRNEANLHDETDELDNARIERIPNHNEIDTTNDGLHEVNLYVNFDINAIHSLFHDSKVIVTVDNITNVTPDLLICNKDVNVLLYLNSTSTTGAINAIDANQQSDLIFGFLPRCLILNEDWELRCLCFTLNSVHPNKNKWIGNLFCKHGTKMFPNWWNILSECCLSKKMEREFDVLTIDETKFGKCCLAIFVRRDDLPSVSYRDTLLQTIGGQSRFICKEHQMPLVVISKSNDLICSVIDENNMPCSRKAIYASCPMLCCSTCICIFHYKLGSKETETRYIELTPTTLNNQYTNLKVESLKVLKEKMEYESNCFYVTQQYDCDYENDSIASESGERITRENESDERPSSNDIIPEDSSSIIHEQDLQSLQNGIDIDLSEVCQLERQNCLGIPCTSAGAGGGIYLCDENKQSFAGSHIILNNCGKLLVRRGIKLKGTKVQQRFLQSIVAKCNGKSVPLLYPEALLFPSIFWREEKFDSSPIGAIPCCLLAQDSTLSHKGCASLLDHFRSRITNTKLLTSTDYKYISFCFDNYLNLQTRHTHTRLILHRGLWNCGLGKSISDCNEPMFDIDSIENRPVVNKLAAAVGETQATYFYTHTCNQHEHFGVKQLKQWIDSSELETIIESKLANTPGLSNDISR